MFGVSPEGQEREVFFTRKAAEKTAFSFAQVREAVHTLLDRKARNNGVGRHLVSMLRLTGACSYEYPHQLRGNRYGFTCRILPNESAYQLMLSGSAANIEFLVHRLNARESLCIAIRSSQELARQTRGTRRRRSSPPQAVAGASRHRQKQHFRNSALKLSVVVSAIAHAIQTPRSFVEAELLASRERTGGGAAVLRRGRFVFRVEFPGYGRGLFDVSGDLSLYTTNDNAHAAYRRLRKYLKRRLNRERKTTRADRESVMAARRYRRRQQILFALRA